MSTSHTHGRTGGMFSDSEIESIRADADLKSIMEADGHRFERAGQDKWKCLCPFHKEKTPSFSLERTQKGYRYKCFGCEVRGDVFDYLNDSRGMDFVAAMDYLGGRRDEQPYRPPSPRPAPPPPKAPVYGPEDTDAAYSLLLRHMPITDAHRAHMMTRCGAGLKPEKMDAIIQRAGIGSVPSQGDLGPLSFSLQVEIAKLPRAAQAVPGMPMVSAAIALPAGAMIIPVRDADGKIVTVRLRTEDRDGKRYAYPTGAAIAVHHPLFAPDRVYQTGIIRLAEGEIKAEVATSETDIYTISFPGIGALDVAVQAAVQAGVPRVVVAFDADFRSKAGVATAMVRMIEDLSAAGLDVLVEIWTEDHKGIDDAIAAGVPTQLHPAASILPHLRQRAEELQAAARAECDAARAVEADGVVVDDDTVDVAAAMAQAMVEDEPIGFDLAITEDTQASRSELIQIAQMSPGEVLGNEVIFRRAMDLAREIGLEQAAHLMGGRLYGAMMGVAQALENMPAELARCKLNAIHDYLSYQRNDFGLLPRLASRLRDCIFYSPGLGVHVYDGRRWVPDDQECCNALNTIEKAIREIVEHEIWAVEKMTQYNLFTPSIDAEYLTLSSDSKRSPIKVEIEEHANWLSYLCSSRKLKDGLKMITRHFKHDDKLVNGEEYAHLLNAQNGIIDLRTGELLPHSPKYLITQITACDYIPTAPRPVFEKFMSEILAEKDGKLDPEYYSHIKRVLGYSAWGDAREETIYSITGPGSNGKSKLLEILLETLGNYATTISSEMLTGGGATRSSSGPSPDLMSIRGVRLIVTAEPDRGAKMAEGMVKKMTGKDTLPARGLFSKDYVHFKVIGKIFMACNELMRITGTDGGIWRRQEVLCFHHRWRSEKDQDPDLQHLPIADRGLDKKLQAEMEGILAYLVEGCIDWQRNGMQYPQRAIDAITGYRQDNDRIAQFLGECVSKTGHGHSVAQSELYRLYRLWCDEAGSNPLARDRFGIALRDHRIQPGRTGSIGHTWVGISIIPEARDQLMAGGYGRRGHGGGLGHGGGGGDWAGPLGEDFTQAAAPQPRKVVREV